jgi:predicted DNA-binding transcriptional regulator YafY
MNVHEWEIQSQQLTESILSTILLCEYIDDQKLADMITKSITRKKKMRLKYEGDKSAGRGWRKIQPVAVGKTKKGDYVLRAWQDGGPSQSDHKPMWRMFRLDKVEDASESLEKFTQAKPGYNPHGDRSMVGGVELNAKF